MEGRNKSWGSRWNFTLPWLIRRAVAARWRAVDSRSWASESQNLAASQEIQDWFLPRSTFSSFDEGSLDSGWYLGLQSCVNRHALRGTSTTCRVLPAPVSFRSTWLRWRGIQEERKCPWVLRSQMRWACLSRNNLFGVSRRISDNPRRERITTVLRFSASRLSPASFSFP